MSAPASQARLSENPDKLCLCWLTPHPAALSDATACLSPERKAAMNTCQLLPDTDRPTGPRETAQTRTASPKRQLPHPRFA